jgi:hypothetical protein
MPITQAVASKSARDYGRQSVTLPVDLLNHAGNWDKFRQLAGEREGTVLLLPFARGDAGCSNGRPDAIAASSA